MAIALPENAQALLTKLVLDTRRAPLVRSAMTAADEALYSPGYVRLAHVAWWRTFAPQVELLGKLSAQTLTKLEGEDHEITAAEFVRRIDQLVVLSAFLYANPYLRELIAASVGDADQFRTLLTLLVQLADLTP